jgi:ATP-dependent DNA helicase PIF1
MSKRKSTSWDDDTPQMKSIQRISILPPRKTTVSDITNRKVSDKKVASSHDIPNKSKGETFPAQFSSTAKNPVVKPSQASYVDKDTEKPITLSPEQQSVLDRVRAGKSIFFTGKAGTGKSMLLRKLISRPHVAKFEMAVTASTGLAAHNIQGITLHSFAGIGLANGAVDDLVRMVQRNKQTLNRWKNTKVLIIDEGALL